MSEGLTALLAGLPDGQCAILAGRGQLPAELHRLCSSGAITVLGRDFLMFDEEEIVQLFLESPTRELTKQQICDALWPRKDNAAETLYTLIHRIKPILDAHSDLRITSNRGRSYRLEHKGETR